MDMNAKEEDNQDYAIEHIEFDWTIDFDEKIIKGSVVLRINNLTKNRSNLLLNSKYLQIENVLVENKDVEFDVGSVHKVDAIGSILSIPIGITDDRLSVVVHYSTTDRCSALQWLCPAATKGKKHPYLFSQCQAIHARSLYPCQDDPAIKFTYLAQVKAPTSMEVLMSATKSSKESSGTLTKHTFEQNIPISSYLVAIVSGNLEGRSVGPRSTVWSEPEMVESAAQEFVDTEKFLSIAESICGPYVWGVYDILVLPPSFPFGGMENPNLTFVTPTTIVGDKSLVTLIAHEITHSWTGNLVTNKTWEDFWLNEGHTRYVERLIMERHYGNSEPMRHFLIETGLACLQESLNNYGRDHPFNQMVPCLKDCDPDDAFSRVPYEKGSNLLFHLESVCGKDQMLRWLRAYLSKYRGVALTTREWQRFFYTYMIEQEKIPEATLDAVDWSAWYFGRWQIPVKHKLDRQITLKCEALADMWISISQIDSEKEKRLLNEWNSFLPELKYYFLQVLNDVRESAFDSGKIAAFGRLYGLTETTNCELLYGWSLLCIRSEYEPAIQQIINFLNYQGRLKYTKPIYSGLYRWAKMRPIAVENFQKYRVEMHPIAENGLRKLLHLED